MVKVGARDFPVIAGVHAGYEAQPASYLKGYRVSLPGVKQPGRVKLTAFIDPTTTLRMRGDTTFLPLTSS